MGFWPEAASRGAENGGHEMTDQSAKHDNAGHEIVKHESNIL